MTMSWRRWRERAVFVEEVDEIPTGAVTVFSAHGVSRRVEAAAGARRLEVIDATCPLVAKVHAQGRRYSAAGRRMVLIGHLGHVEVEGTLGQIDGPVHVVASAGDVAALDCDPTTPIAYITQTTLSVDDTRSIIAAPEQRFVDLQGPDVGGICYATQNRQRAVRQLARDAEVILVIGVANSSNSTRLREIGGELGVPSHLLADATALEPDWLAGKTVVGVTAGASAPDFLVSGLLRRLWRLGYRKLETLDGIREAVSFKLPDQVGGGMIGHHRRQACPSH